MYERVRQKRFDIRVKETESQRELYQIYIGSHSEITRITAVEKLKDTDILEKIFDSKKTEMTIKTIAAEKMFNRSLFLDVLFEDVINTSLKKDYIYETLRKANLTNSQVIYITERYFDIIVENYDSPIIYLLRLRLNVQNTDEAQHKIYINKLYDILIAQSVGLAHDNDFMDKLADVLLNIDTTMKSSDKTHKLIDIIKPTYHEFLKLGEILGKKMRDNPSSALADKLIFLYKTLKSESFMNGIHADGKIKYTRNYITRKHGDSHDHVDDNHMDACEKDSPFHYDEDEHMDRPHTDNSFGFENKDEFI
jgi:hypothetical protein